MAPGGEGRTALTYSGEVWTDARGLATVALPRAADGLRGNLEYELSPSPSGIVANVVGRLIDGRFTIATEEPHVKVAWRISARGRDNKEER